jgi:hypothetical protein
MHYYSLGLLESAITQTRMTLDSEDLYPLFSNTPQVLSCAIVPTMPLTARM